MNTGKITSACTLLFVLLIGLFCLSCQKQKLKDDLIRIYGQVITNPTDMQCFEGEVFKFTDLQDNRQRIVIWYDSTECSICRINNLHKYPAVKNDLLLTQITA